jgi:hypothetical protein
LQIIEGAVASGWGGRCHGKSCGDGRRAEETAERREREIDVCLTNGFIKRPTDIFNLISHQKIFITKVSRNDCVLLDTP